MKHLKKHFFVPSFRNQTLQRGGFIRANQHTYALTYKIPKNIILCGVYEKAPPTGIEPVTSRLTASRSNQLS